MPKTLFDFDKIVFQKMFLESYPRNLHHIISNIRTNPQIYNFISVDLILEMGYYIRARRACISTK